MIFMEQNTINSMLVWSDSLLQPFFLDIQGASRFCAMQICPSRDFCTSFHSVMVLILPVLRSWMSFTKTWPLNPSPGTPLQWMVLDINLVSRMSVQFHSAEGKQVLVMPCFHAVKTPLIVQHFNGSSTIFCPLWIEFLSRNLPEPSVVRETTDSASTVYPKVNQWIEVASSPTKRSRLCTLPFCRNPTMVCLLYIISYCNKGNSKELQKQYMQSVPCQPTS